MTPSKKAQNLSITTIILLVLGVFILIGLILATTMGWDEFKSTVSAALGSDMAQAKRDCKIQCSTGNDFDFCESRTVGGTEYANCLVDELIPKDCTITTC